MKLTKKNYGKNYIPGNPTFKYSFR